MDSTDRPFSMHDPEERTCSYCGDIFYSEHGLQQYCPVKFGKRNYCKYEQKKMVAEGKLSTAAEKWARTGLPVFEKEAPLDFNFRVLWEIMGSESEKVVSSELLDEKGYIPSVYESRTQMTGSVASIIKIGCYNVAWIGHNGAKFTFIITKQ